MISLRNLGVRQGRDGNSCMGRERGHGETNPCVRRKTLCKPMIQVLVPVTDSQNWTGGRKLNADPAGPSFALEMR